MDKKSLAQLYVEHQGKVSDKWSIYLAEYGKIFAEYRDHSVQLLEIGIQNGGSLEIWAKYFTNPQKLVGCDINQDCARLSYEDERIAVVVGDANEDATLAKILSHASTFDIIIDDGSHRSSDIIKTFARYFSHLADGGVFIAEDLHCSYWQEFEGGLFDPFSSIAFFKRLADIGNFEHWGVEKRRSDILEGFFKKYDFQINEESLKSIHSVEFLNSMCVIRKNNPEQNRLGKRFIAGSVEAVVPGHLQLHSEYGKALNQNGNDWATRKLPPDEEFPNLVKELARRNSEVERLNFKIEQLNGEQARLLNSKSWRLTAPIRTLSAQLRKSAIICFFSKGLVKALNMQKKSG